MLTEEQVIGNHNCNYSAPLLSLIKMKKLETEEIIRITTEEFKAAEKMPLTIVLDGIRSLNNVGSIFRTSDAYRVEKLMLCGITATPPNAEIHKSALGAEFSVDWESFDDTTEAVRKLHGQGYEIWAVEQATDSVWLDDFNFDKEKRYAIVMGNEVNGVQQEVIDMCDGCIELPQYGTKHSLNVAVTTGIVIYNFASHLLK